MTAKRQWVLAIVGLLAANLVAMGVLAASSATGAASRRPSA